VSAGKASEETAAPSAADGVVMMNGAASMVESKMAQLGAAEAAMGLNGTSFYFGANVTSYFDYELENGERVNVANDISSIDARTAENEAVVTPTRDVPK
jgi:hypothetical protein